MAKTCYDVAVGFTTGGYDTTLQGLCKTRKQAVAIARKLCRKSRSRGVEVVAVDSGKGTWICKRRSK